MLKDSDDESSSHASSGSPARRTLHTRPKSMHALTISSTTNLHSPSAGAGLSQSGIPMPSTGRSRTRSQSTSETQPLRHRQSDSSLANTRLQQQRGTTGLQKPGSMIRAVAGPRSTAEPLKQPSVKSGHSSIGRAAAAGATAKLIPSSASTNIATTNTTVVRAQPTLAKPRVVAARHTSVKVVQAPSAASPGTATKGKGTLLPGSTSSGTLTRSSSASSKIPGSSKSGSTTSSPSSSISQPIQLLQQHQGRSSSTGTSKAALTKDTQRKSTMPTPMSRSRQASSTSLSSTQLTKTSAPSKQQQSSAMYSRSIKQPQQQQPPAAISQPIVEPTAAKMNHVNEVQGGNQWSTQELIQELERWKAEAQAFKAERAAAESWQQQYLILQRDLDAALDSLQAAEERAHRAETNTRVLEDELHAAVATRDDHAMMLEELTVARESREHELEALQDDHRQQIEEQAAKIAQLEVENDDLQRKLEQAQQEMEQAQLEVDQVRQEMDQLVETQAAAPPDVQEVQRQLSETTHELQRVKADHAKVIRALEEEKERLAMEQADAGHLLSKLSRLQDINANLVRDNNALKERMLEHDSCLEREQATAAKHLRQVESFQAEIRSLQQKLDQAQEHVQALERTYKDQERTFKDQERQYMQLQQQVQIQQTQLQQQQAEIVTLRATVEVERQQNQLWLQHQQQQLQAARAQQAASGSGGDMSFNNDNSSFTGRRPSVDGDIGGSMTMADTSAIGSMGMGFDGLPPMPISTAKASTIMNRTMDGSSTPLPSSNADMSSGSITGVLPGGNQHDVNARTLHRSSSGSVASVLGSTTSSNNRHSIHGDIMSTQLQAELSKIPISGGGPMTRRKVEMLEEQMDETDRAMSKIRYSIRMRS
ncbi:hypothetical protein BGW41_002980 [Actinomortierella wolfii]|nr:hypothetical protein BGW41_002980 [Actinomortierella wolfii]